MTRPHYAVIVENATTGETFHTYQGKPIDPTEVVRLTDQLSITHGIDPAGWPGPLYPATTQFTLAVATSADLPDWKPGDPIRVQLFRPTVTNWTPADTSQHWFSGWFRVTDVALRITSGVVRMDVIAVDYVATLSGQTTTVSFPGGQLDVDRTAALLDALDGVTGYPALGSNSVCGPFTMDAAPIMDTLEQVLAGATSLGTSRPVLYGVHYTAPEGPGVTGWYLESQLVKDSLDEDYGPPFKLVLHAPIATADPSTTPDTGPQRTLTISACHLPLTGLVWRYERPTNTIWVTTIKADATTSRVARAHVDIVRASGSQTREVNTQLSNTAAFDLDTALETYLPESTGSIPRWVPVQAVISLRRMDDAEVDHTQQRLRMVNGGSPIEGMLTVTDIAADLDVTGRGYVSGTIAQTTWTIANGDLTITADLAPSHLAVTNASSDADGAATFNMLAASGTLAGVQYTGGNHIDPTITYADMRLIGV